MHFILESMETYGLNSGQQKKEINQHAFWRITFYNLDFRIKFAKCLSTGGHLKSMLDLLTSQVTFRNSVNNSLANISEPVKITEEHFKLEHDNSE